MPAQSGEEYMLLQSISECYIKSWLLCCIIIIIIILRIHCIVVTLFQTDPDDLTLIYQVYNIYYIITSLFLDCL